MEFDTAVRYGLPFVAVVGNRRGVERGAPDTAARFRRGARERDGPAPRTLRPGGGVAGRLRRARNVRRGAASPLSSAPSPPAGPPASTSRSPASPPPRSGDTPRAPDPEAPPPVYRARAQREGAENEIRHVRHDQMAPRRVRRADLGRTSWSRSMPRTAWAYRTSGSESTTSPGTASCPGYSRSWGPSRPGPGPRESGPQSSCCRSTIRSRSRRRAPPWTSSRTAGSTWVWGPAIRPRSSTAWA